MSEGHPDKLADQISDAILDRFLELDSHSRVACETLIADGLVVIAGEFKTRVPAIFDQVRSEAESIARAVLRDAGYADAATGIDPDACQVMVRMNHQSLDINRGVDQADGVIGAGDQGLMFGYATNETPERLPLPLVIAHQLVRRQAALRKSGELPWLGPDAKSQVTVRYADGRPVEVTAVVLSTQHADTVSIDEVRAAVEQHIVLPLLKTYAVAPDLQLHINPTGRFVTGGPKGDTGLTGGKIIVDTYGGAHRTAEVRSRGRTRPRSTALQPMQLAISPTWSSRVDGPNAAWSSCPTRSVLRSRSASPSKPLEPNVSPWKRLLGACRQNLT